MSVTSRITFQRSAAQQPAANLYGPMGASVLGGGSNGTPGPTPAAPSSTQMATGGAPAAGGITFVQAVLGVATLILIWWAITLVLERLLPLKDTPDFIREFLHGFRIAVLTAIWFLLWKMTAGVAPFNMSAPYVTIAAAI